MEFNDTEIKNMLTRKVPKRWEPYMDQFGMDEIGRYLYLMQDSLKGIKKYYQKEFDADNIYPIQDYIDFSQYLIKKITDLLLDESKVELYVKINPLKSNDLASRCIYIKNPYLCKESAFTWTNDDKDTNGFSDETYKQIKPLLKKIFMIEKLCSFTTRKIWANEMTNIKDLDLNKDYKILVKSVGSANWRCQTVTRSLLKYFDSRKYCSSSLIDKKHKDYTFSICQGRGINALLVLDVSPKDIIAGNFRDSFSEETINGNNPLTEKTIYTELSMLDRVQQDGKKHKLYATAVETITPQYILNSVYHYSEINVKDAKVVAIIPANRASIDFSKMLAEKKGVPFIMPEEYK